MKYRKTWNVQVLYGLMLREYCSNSIHTYCRIYFHKFCTYAYWTEITSVKCNESVPGFTRYFRLYIGLYHFVYCYFFSACWGRIWYGTEFCNSGCSEYQAHARAIGSLPSEFTGNILRYWNGLPWQPLILMFIKYILYDFEKLGHNITDVGWPQFRPWSKTTWIYVEFFLWKSHLQISKTL